MRIPPNDVDMGRSTSSLGWPLNVSPVRLDQMTSGEKARSSALVGTDCLTNLSASSSGTTKRVPGMAASPPARSPRRASGSLGWSLEGRRIDGRLSSSRAVRSAEEIARRRALVGQLEAGAEPRVAAGQLDLVGEERDPQQLRRRWPRPSTSAPGRRAGCRPRCCRDDRGEDHAGRSPSPALAATRSCEPDLVDRRDRRRTARGKRRLQPVGRRPGCGTASRSAAAPRRCPGLTVRGEVDGPQHALQHVDE